MMKKILFQWFFTRKSCPWSLCNFQTIHFSSINLKTVHQTLNKIPVVSTSVSLFFYCGINIYYRSYTFLVSLSFAEFLPSISHSTIRTRAGSHSLIGESWKYWLINAFMSSFLACQSRSILRSLFSGLDFRFPYDFSLI